MDSPERRTAEHTRMWQAVLRTKGKAGAALRDLSEAGRMAGARDSSRSTPSEQLGHSLHRVASPVLQRER